MSRLFEFAVFAGVALSLHLGLWISVGDSGSEAQGAQGQTSVSLVPSSDGIAEMVSAWTRPPEVTEAVAVLPDSGTLTPTALAWPSSEAPETNTLPKLPQSAVPTPAPLPEALPLVETESTRSAILDRAPAASPRPAARPEPRPEAPVKTVKKQPQTLAVPKQRAAGGQAGQNAGNAQAQRSATLSKATQQRLLAQWGAAIRNRVERQKRYPRGVAANGTTILRISVTTAGRLNGVGVAKSSGHPKLDQAAVAAVKRARYPAAPESLGGGPYRFNLPVGFSRK